MAKKKVRDEKKDDEDVFRSLDVELVEMRVRMDRIFEAFMKNELGPDRAPPVYSFSMHMDQDGEPLMQEFGNAPAPARIGGGELQEREPLIDVIESSEQIRVIVELPGVKKEDIKVEARESSLKIEVDKDIRRFQEQIELPCDVLPDSIKASYKNGVLELSMKRVATRKKGRTVKVE